MGMEKLIAAGIPLSDNSAVSLLHAEAALDWMLDNTTLEFDKDAPATVAALPASAKLFVVKFVEVMSRNSAVASQSIEGLSMSFDTSKDANASVWALAQALLKGYLKSSVKVYPARRRW